MAVRGKPIAMILARDLAAHIATPVFIVDPQGTLVFFNEPAEAILGRTFSEVGELTADEWGTRWDPVDPETGEPFPVHSLPLALAVAHKQPAHAPMRIQGMDGVSRTIEVVAFPLLAHEDEFVGAIAIFWERDGD